MTKPWHKKWVPFALLELGKMRKTMREKNLLDTEQIPAIPGSGPKPVDPNAPLPKVRTVDGAYTDAKDPEMGRAGKRLTRNMPLGKNETASR